MPRGKVSKLARCLLRQSQLFHRENPTVDAAEVGERGTAATNIGRPQLTRTP